MSFSTKNNDKPEDVPATEKKTKRVSKKKLEAESDTPVTPKKRMSKKAKELEES
jgi:hypothetical protein